MGEPDSGSADSQTLGFGFRILARGYHARGGRRSPRRRAEDNVLGLSVGGVQTGVVQDLSYAYIRLYLSYTGIPDGSQLTHIGTSAGAAQDAEAEVPQPKRKSAAGCVSVITVAERQPVPVVFAK